MRRKPPGYLVHWKMFDGSCIQYVSVGAVFISPVWYMQTRSHLRINTPRSMGPEEQPSWHTPSESCYIKNPFHEKG